MARPTFQQLAPARQDEILQLAGLEFARSGFQGTSYNQLLERLHLGKSSAYYYFDDKRDLFLTVLERCYAAFFAVIASLPRPRTARAFWEFMGDAASRGFEFMNDDPMAAGLIQCLYRERAQLGELMSFEQLATMSDFYEQLVVEGQQLSAVRTDIPQALLVDTLRNLSVTVDQWFIDERQKADPASSAAQAAALFTDLARRMLESHAEKRG